ncbi:MAG TPA: sensor histidine kinase [Alphaproteobacteria bacterium]|nr:sensor histidine kinase [Alphaproteobacteria bacterium]
MLRTATETFRRRDPGERFLQLAAVLAILLAVFITIAVARAERREAVREAEVEAGHAARLLAEEIGGIISIVDLILAQAKDLAGPADQPIPSSRDAWEKLVRLGHAAPLLKALWFGGPDGAAVLSTHQYPAPTLSAADRDYFIAQRDGDPGLYLGVVQRDRYAAEPMLVFSRRLDNSDGSFRGFVTAAISPEPLRSALSRVSEKFGASIMRSDGALIVGVPSEQPEIDGSPDSRFAEAVTLVPFGVYEDDAGSGEARLVIFQRIQTLDLFVRLDVLLKPILDAWSHTHLLAYVLLGIAAVISILGWSWLALTRTRRAEVTVGELEQVREGLEERISAHTDSLRRANQRLAEAVADKEVLYREVHHRVKNTLQVVISLLQLQAARLAPEARRPFEDSVARISAMSLVHELLYRSEQPSRIDFSLYLRTVAEALLARRGERGRIALNLDGEVIYMDLDRAVPLGLLVNELIGAALDQGFAGGRQGTLLLRFRREPEGARLEISHDGLTEEQMPTGFGLLLVDALAGQIGASVVPERSDGTGFTIFVPLPTPNHTRSRAVS